MMMMMLMMVDMHLA